MKDEILPNDVVLDENVPLSRSELWRYQRDYYVTNSIDAWAGKIPFYITSNPYIADSYANIIIRFVIDCLRSGAIADDQPFYIVELGAGSGKFAFHLINRLDELKTTLSIDIAIVYVMTDLVQANIDFWKSHEAFQPFVNAHKIDFASFDAESTKEIYLQHAGIVLDSNTTKNPFVFIANYFFDTLRQDLFYLNDQKLYQALCRVTADQSNLADLTPIELSKIKINFSYSGADFPYYQSDNVNVLLKEYTQSQQDQFLLLPIGAFMCIEKLQKISSGKMLLLCSDKGFSKHLDVYQREEPQLVFHDNCFSLSVNFDALMRYFRITQGDSFLQFTEQSLVTSAFMNGYEFANMNETSLALDTFLNSFGHSTINNIFLRNEMSGTLNSIETILPFLGASKWDAVIFNRYRDTIIHQIRSGFAKISDVEDLKEKMSEIEKTIYKMPNAIDTYFDIGLFFQEARSYEKALEFFSKSLEHFGAKDNTYYNMGLCHYFAGRSVHAIEQFSKALEHNPHYIMARGWRAQIELETTGNPV